MKPIGAAIAAGVVVGLIIGLLLKAIPTLGNLIPADWHSAVAGGLAGIAAAIAAGKSASKD